MSQSLQLNQISCEVNNYLIYMYETDTNQNETNNHPVFVIGTIQHEIRADYSKQC